MQSLECLWIAEEAGHIDQKIVIESSRFLGFALQESGVILEFLDLLQRHAPLNTARDRRRFVSRKIDPGLPPQQAKNLIHIAFVAA